MSTSREWTKKENSFSTLNHFSEFQGRGKKRWVFSYFSFPFSIFARVSRTLAKPLKGKGPGRAKAASRNERPWAAAAVMQP